MFVMGWFHREQSYLAYFGALMVGWALLLVLVFALTGCTGPSDYETDVIVAQDLQDAVMQARGER